MSETVGEESSYSRNLFNNKVAFYIKWTKITKEDLH